MNKMKITGLLMTFLMSIALLTACQSGTESKAGTATATISDELAQHAYDTIFTLSFATIEAETGAENISMTIDGGVSTFQFDDMNYLQDDSGATVKGYMKSIDEALVDRSDVDLVFKNDPQGLKTITLKSNGLKGQTHSEGTLIINGAERPFLEFVDYFANKFQQEVAPVEPFDPIPSS